MNVVRKAIWIAVLDYIMNSSKLRSLHLKCQAIIEIQSIFLKPKYLCHSWFEGGHWCEVFPQMLII